MPLPVEIVGLGKSSVRLVWEDGNESTFLARDMRLFCSCAHCVDEGTGQKILRDEQVPQDITVAKMDLVGTYGLQIEFSDGHNTGIYRFADLLARTQGAPDAANT